MVFGNVSQRKTMLQEDAHLVHDGMPGGLQAQCARHIWLRVLPHDGYMRKSREHVKQSNRLANSEHVLNLGANAVQQLLDDRISELNGFHDGIVDAVVQLLQVQREAFNEPLFLVEVDENRGNVTILKVGCSQLNPVLPSRVVLDFGLDLVGNC